MRIISILIIEQMETPSLIENSENNLNQTSYPTPRADDDDDQHYFPGASLRFCS